MITLKNNKGNTTVLAVVISLIIIFIMCVIFEYMKMVIITTGIRNAVQSAVIAAITSNYDDTYSQLREGYSGGYEYRDTGFIEIIDTGDIYGRLDSLLGLTQEGDQHVKYTAAGIREYSLYDMQIQFENPILAQGNADKNLTAAVRICVEIPVRYNGGEILSLKLNMRIRASYIPKF